MLFRRAPLPEIETVGVRAIWHRDLYHAMLRAPWWLDVMAISTAFLLLNILFTFAYVFTGGVAHAESFADLFFFSVQTMATIGYGVMFPETVGAHVLVTGEAVCGILFTAVTTGVVFTVQRAACARAICIARSHLADGRCADPHAARR